jgi:hypothetical protein
MWTQIVGKIALAQAPPLNHSWSVAFVVTPRGLMTRTLPYGERTFTMEFDFINHQLVIRTSDGVVKNVQLAPRSVASFYADVMATMAGLGLPVKIWTMTSEIPVPIRLDTDEAHHSYDPVLANRCWIILSKVARVLDHVATSSANAARCISSGARFDLAVTRFSDAPPREPGFHAQACRTVSATVSGSGRAVTGAGVLRLPSRTAGAQGGAGAARGAFYGGIGEFVLPSSG